MLGYDGPLAGKRNQMADLVMITSRSQKCGVMSMWTGPAKTKCRSQASRPS